MRASRNLVNRDRFVIEANPNQISGIPFVTHFVTNYLGDETETMKHEKILEEQLIKDYELMGEQLELVDELVYASPSSSSTEAALGGQLKLGGAFASSRHRREDADAQAAAEASGELAAQIGAGGNARDNQKPDKLAAGDDDEGESGGIETEPASAESPAAAPRTKPRPASARPPLAVEALRANNQMNQQQAADSAGRRGRQREAARLLMDLEGEFSCTCTCTRHAPTLVAGQSDR